MAREITNAFVVAGYVLVAAQWDLLQLDFTEATKTVVEAGSVNWGHSYLIVRLVAVLAKRRWISDDRGGVGVGWLMVAVV